MHYKGIKINWPALLCGNGKKKILSTLLPTGITVERERCEGVEKITVKVPETVEPINMDAVRNMNVIEPIYVHPNKPSFFISEEPVIERGSWKIN